MYRMKQARVALQEYRLRYQHIRVPIIFRWREADQ